jgi:hypothetical protein
VLAVGNADLLCRNSARKTHARGYRHHILLIHVIVGLRHRDLKVVNIIHHIRGPYECVAQQKYCPIHPDDAEVA